MAKQTKTKYLLFATLLITLILAVVVVLMENDADEYQDIGAELPVHYNGKQFAGSASCIPCHESIYRTHLGTAHANTSAVANERTLLGSFGAEDDRIDLMGSSVKMVREEDAHYQLRVVQGKGSPLDKSQIAMVIGSGVKGQSHLTWRQDSLYQLQASYFTATDDWINSPGFPNYPFKRPITDECIKCHVTFARNSNFSGKTNAYDKQSFIYGISCERCHGPLQDHADHHSSDAGDGVSKFVVQIDTLNRQLQLDVCAQCHSGLRADQVAGNPFSYLAGKKLEDYTRNFQYGRPNAGLDVHSNQYGLLKSSACFKNSSAMTCTTCHNPHNDQRDKTEYFNAKCTECHTRPEKVHKLSSGDTISNLQNCIDCHMPVFPSETMRVRLKNEDSEKSVNIRTHLIGVYVDKVLQNQ